MIVIATVYEYDYKATVVYIRHMNIITSVWLLLPCPWPFTAVYFANNATFDDITLRMGNIEKERHNNPPRMIKEQVHSRKAHYNNENV